MAALTADQIQARIDALQASRDAGVLMVRHGDTTTQFRSLAEMNQILSSLKRDLAKLNGTAKSKVNYISECDKGYGPTGVTTDGWETSNS